VVETRVILVRHLGQAKIRALAGVRRNHIVDDHRVMRGGHAGQRLQLRLGAQLRVDFETDAVEVTVDGWRLDRAAQTTGHFQRPIVNTLDTDFRQRMPQGFIAQCLKHSAVFAGDDGCRIRGEPH